ncbi:MAG: sigma-70 family RNA polymerase sigma factor [Bacteroidia bacterium]|nr:sigma-70 family RNA polymerase sigma factor [Bacteroidia bacterium]MCZ2247615.1 sigma-70 family RNA polymerase sigma factor [Bacteroidia bacterium]
MSIPEEKYQHLSDLELFQLYKISKDPVTIGLLYKRYLSMSLAIATKYLLDENRAKDAVMSVFEQLLNNAEGYQISNFKSWLYSVIKNYCFMELRKEKNRIMVSIDEKNTTKFMENNNLVHQSNEHYQELQYQGLEQAIELLNDEQRKCIELFYLQQKCYADIAELTGYSLNNVKSYIQNGKRNLKNKLQNFNG